MKKGLISLLIGMAIIVAAMASCTNNTNAPESNTDSTNITVVDSTSIDSVAADSTIEVR